MAESDETAIFEDLLLFLQRSRGFDFSGYKRSSLMRRIRKQMLNCGIDTFSDYLDYLQVHPEEFLPLFNSVLINVTSFFRDAPAWQYLQDETLPGLLDNESPTEPIRIWSAGCASGEEAYTLAMILAEKLGLEQFRQRVKIYATDVDEEALSEARQATYGPQALAGIPERFRNQYFEPVNDHYVFRADLRRAVIFGRHDLMQDAPISRLDLLVCRNTLMYFNAETQTDILDRFHFALKDSGVLFLGKAEMLLTHGNLFTPISLQHRIFRLVPKPNRRARSLAFSPTSHTTTSSINQYIQLREAALEAVHQAQLLVSLDGILILANAQARSLFNINLLDQGRPLQDLEISYRPLELRSAIEQACQSRQPVVIRDIARPQPNQDVQYLTVEIVPLDNVDGDLNGVSITFIDVTAYHYLQIELQRANQELETTNEELQSSNEELETTNEELQSTNEELETTNEELQSSNEELETINEELQSTNEELQTINEELRQRTGDLNQANAFLNSILISLRAGVVVVNPQFNILSWNPEAENLWGLRAAEVQGESIFNLDIGLPVEQLREPMRNCMAGHDERQDMVLAAMNRRGRTIQCRVSCNPLLGFDQGRQGIILLMEELEP
ncbi:MAG: PAS domain-containing protein [Cyanobacteria bacterium]|nr:PAS domain-containing protein [Cyanobacteriota bacterium]